jgi:hypothetical protein
LFLVREAFPSRATGVEVTAGRLGAGDALELVSEMNDGGVLFGDGMEEDRLAFDWGRSARLGCAPQTLDLLVAA